MTTKILQIFLIQCFTILIVLTILNVLLFFLTILDTMFYYSYFPFINTPTRVTGHSKTLIDNIFYNKPMLNITAGNISCVISDDLIQFLIEPSLSNAKLEQTCIVQRCYKKFDKAKFKNDLHKIS